VYNTLAVAMVLTSGIVAMVAAHSPRLYRRVQLLYVPSSRSLLSFCL